MDAKKFTDEVLGLCHLDRYDSCGKHRSFFSDGSGHCDKWQDYFYASAATLTAYKDELISVIKELREVPSEEHIWVTDRWSRQAAYDSVLKAINE